MLNAIAKPFGILLLWLYDFLNNYGLAIILFALIVKVILLPFMAKSKRGSLRTQSIQPLVAELQKRHGANQQKFNEELQKLYREEKISPLGGCIWSLIPFPILIALYQAIRFPLTIMMRVDADLVKEGGALYTLLQQSGYSEWHAEKFTKLNAGYEQIAMSQFITEKWDALKDQFLAVSDRLRAIDYNFLGLDLGAQPSFKFWTFDYAGGTANWLPQFCLFLIPVIAAALTLVSSLLAQKLNPPASTADPNQRSTAGTMKIMTYMMPLMTLWFAFLMPAALGLYWIASTLFGILQDVALTKYYKKKMAKETAERDARMKRKMAEIQAKHEETERLRAENATEQNPNTSSRKQQQKQREQQRQKAAEWEKKNNPTEEKIEPGRVGDRRYARGRAYDPDRFAGAEDSAEEPETEDNGASDALETDNGLKD